MLNVFSPSIDLWYVAMLFAILVMVIIIIEVLRACTRLFGPEPGSDEDDSDFEMTAFSRLEEESP